MGKSKDEENTETTFTDVQKAEEKAYQGSHLKEGYNPSHKGPIQNRSCTDVICCIIFVIFFLGLGAVGIFAFVNGDPELLIYPEDSNGNLCGLGDYKDRPNLFFFDLVKCGRMGPGVFVNGCPTPQVCVAKCPDKNWIAGVDSKADAICVSSADRSKDIATLVLDNDCAPYYLKSESVINRCLPIKNLLDFANLAGNMIVDNRTLTVDGKNVTGDELEQGLTVFDQFLKAKEYGEKIIADVVASWWMILVGLAASMVIALLWIFLMRWLAGFMVWLTILIFVVLWLGIAIFCWYFYFEYKGKDDEFTVYLVWRLVFSKEDTFLAGGIIFSVIFLIVFLILLFLCSRIRIAIALIKEGSKAIGSMMSTLLWPIFPFIFHVAVIALWGCIATYLASIGRSQDFGANSGNDTNSIKEKVKDLFVKVPCNANESAICGYFKYADGDFTIYLQIYNLFMLFWLVFFVTALGELTLAGSFASWYWAFNKPKDIPALPVLKSFWRSFRYHLGSLAFGSLLIAIVRMIRVFLEYLDSKLKGSENAVAKFFLKCLKCCFWCLEKFLKFLTKNAYIMMAVYGRNFCSSAKRAFQLILTNAVRTVTVDKTTDYVLFVCKLIVVGGTGVIAYFFFDGRISFLSEYQPKLNFFIVPIIIVVVGSYIIADTFFGVYEMAVDTLFLCFLEDLEHNDGSPEKPYFMNKSLMKILGKKNKDPKSDE